MATAAPDPAVSLIVTTALTEQTTTEITALAAETERLRRWLLVIRCGRATDQRSGYQFPDTILADMAEDIDAALRGDPAPEPRQVPD